MRLIGKMKVKKLLKSQGRAKFRESASHAMDGITYTVSHERNFRIELAAACFVTLLSYFLKVSVVEWCILLLTISLVLVLEMLNTAIERTVDLVTKDYYELAKNAKDVAAGAVLVASMFSVVLGILIFLPKIISLLK